MTTTTSVPFVDGFSQAKRLAEIKARLKAVTPGQWDTEKYQPQQVQTKLQGLSIAYFGKNTICSSQGFYEITREQAEANASMVAHAPDDLRYLLSCIEELHEELNAARVRTGEISV